MIGIPSLAQMPEAIATAFKGTWAQMAELFLVEHDDDGKHTNITAQSVVVEENADTDATGSVTADGDGTFAGDVVAQSGTMPVTVGAIGSTPGVRLQSVVTPTSTDSDWAIIVGLAGAPRVLSLRDMLELGDAAMLDIVRTGSSAYDVRPHSSAVSLNVGTDVSGQRAASVNATVVNTPTLNATTAQADLLQLTGRLAPAQITSNQNNYAINTASRVFISSDAARDITGIVAGSDGQLLWLVNFGGFAITLKNNSGSSAAANRIVAANSADVVLRAGNGSALLQYDSGSALWYVLGA